MFALCSCTQAQACHVFDFEFDVDELSRQKQSKWSLDEGAGRSLYALQTT